MPSPFPAADLEALGRDWVAAWNARDIDRMLTLYADECEMSSVVAIRLGATTDGVVRGKEALRRYWAHALTLITDLYRRPDVSYRLFGIGVNRFDGERWLELWADNQWGAIALSGKPEDGKAMVMTTLIPSRKRDLRLVWETQADGSVRTLQYVAPAGSGKWELYGDLIYRPNR